MMLLVWIACGLGAGCVAVALSALCGCSTVTCNLSGLVALILFIRLVPMPSI